MDKESSLPLVLTLKTGYQMYLKDSSGVLKEIASIFPFQGDWVAQYLDAQVEQAFKSNKGERQTP